MAIKKSVFLLTSAPSINRRREAEASNESNLPFLGRNSIRPAPLALLGERPARLESLPRTREMLLLYWGEEAFSTFHTLSTKGLKLLFQYFSPSSLMAIFFSSYCLGQKLWTIQTTLLFLSHPTSNRSANYLQRSCLFSSPPLLFPPLSKPLCYLIWFLHPIFLSLCSPASGHCQDITRDNYAKI